MRFCTTCGKEIPEGSTFCPSCGAAVGAPNPVPRSPAATDAPNTGMAVLGFFIPIVGLILWICMKDETPLKAKSAGKGALIGFIVGLILVVLGVIAYVALIASIFSHW